MAKKQREKSKKRLFTVIAAVVVIALAAAALLYIPAYRREHEIKSAYPDVTYDSRKFAETDWNRDVSADEDYMGLDRALYMKNGGEEIGYGEGDITAEVALHRSSRNISPRSAEGTAMLTTVCLPKPSLKSTSVRARLLRR